MNPKKELLWSPRVVQFATAVVEGEGLMGWCIEIQALMLQGSGFQVPALTIPRYPQPQFLNFRF